MRPNPNQLHLRSPQLLEAVGTLAAGPATSRRGAEHAESYKQLESAIDAARYEIRIGSADVAEPLMNAYTLSAVLRQLAEAWPDALTRVYRRDKDHYMEVEQAFRNFFGIQPRIIDGRVELRSEQGKTFYEVAGADYLLLGMATVAARTCRAFWRTRTERPQMPRLIVQVPVDPGEDRMPAWKNTIAGEANLQFSAGGEDPVDVIPNHALGNSSDTSVPGFNPYVMIVYVSDGVSSLEDVATLDSWQSDDDLSRCLAAAERRDVLMAFQGGRMWSDYRGSGFTDPCYVQNEQLRLARWRPWATDADQALHSDADRAELLIALAYAWVGPEWFLRQLQNASGSKTLGPVFKYGKRAAIAMARYPVAFLEGYDRTKPFGFPSVKARGFQDMPANGTVVADSLDELLRVVDPFTLGGGAAAQALRGGLVNEYRSFLEHVGMVAGFHPEFRLKGFLEVMESMKGYIADRIAGQRTDPEHPSNSDQQIEAERAHAEKFWRAAAAAVDGLTDRLGR